MKYHLTYKTEFHPEGLTIEQVKEDPNRGCCTALLVGSLLYPEDGSYSAMFVSVDGRTQQPLSDAEVWKVWVMLSGQLADSKTLSPNMKELCVMVWETVVAAMCEIIKTETTDAPDRG